MLLWHLSPTIRHSLKVPEFLSPNSLAPSSMFPPWQVLFLVPRSSITTQALSNGGDSLPELWEGIVPGQVSIWD